MIIINYKGPIPPFITSRDPFCRGIAKGFAVPETNSNGLPLQLSVVGRIFRLSFWDGSRPFFGGVCS